MRRAIRWSACAGCRIAPSCSRVSAGWMLRAKCWNRRAQKRPPNATPPLLLRFDYVDAIQLYFAKHFTEARNAMLDVVERARRTGDDMPLIGECESALALFMQREGDVRAAARYARAVLANSGATLESRYRAFLALGSLHQDAYDYEEAARLYGEAEGLVHQLDDDIAMSSWLQRSALTQAAHARQAAAMDELDARTLANAVNALKRSIAFAGGLPDGPDTTLNHLLLAEMLVLQKRYGDAIALYDAHLPSAEGDGFLHEVTAALADRANCCIELGRVDEGTAPARCALARVDEATPSDIRAIVHSNMATALKAAAAATRPSSIDDWPKWHGRPMHTSSARRDGCWPAIRPRRCTRSIAMAWEVVIGLETHAQLTTASKIFSGASTAFGAEPNSQASVIDVALPGTLPVLNRGAVERAIRFGLAIGATIAPRSVFARKNYFYPDLPKGYQISQYEIPVVQGGSLTFVVQPKGGDAYMKTVRLTRAHLEEDAGKSLHEDFHGMSGIDLNRAGTPLLEIVSEPDIRVASVGGAATEAVAYARALHSLVVWLGICDGNMQEGSFRCDANVSVRPVGQAEFGTRCEIKNLNSFRFMQQAIEFEARRQIELIEDGGTVVQETRLYDPDRDETRSMRSKEDAMDYRYFPDPDLLPLEISTEWIDRVRAELPELPGAMRERFVREYGLSEYDAQTLTASRDVATYYEGVARLVDDRKVAANWVMGEVAAAVNADGVGFDAARVNPAQLAEIIGKTLDGTINAKECEGRLRADLDGQVPTGRRSRKLCHRARRCDTAPA